MKEIQNPKLLEDEFGIKFDNENNNNNNSTPIKSHSVSKFKIKKRKKKIKKNENENIPIISNDENIDNNIPERNQMMITNFVTTKKNCDIPKIDTKDGTKLKITATYGDENEHSNEKKMKELLKNKEKKNKKEKKISTQNLLRDLNMLSNKEEEYNFEFLNKFEKFDNETDSMFNLFINVPTNNNNKRINDSKKKDENKNDELNSNEKKKDNELLFLNTIENLNNFM
jgi:hypothetical protein